MTVKGLSPAVAAGISDTLWSMTDLTEMVDADLERNPQTYREAVPIHEAGAFRALKEVDQALSRFEPLRRNPFIPPRNIPSGQIPFKARIRGMNVILATYRVSCYLDNP